MPRRGSARTTTRRRSSPARPVPSTSGRAAWASNTSTASTAARPTSGSRSSIATTTRIYPYVDNPGYNLITDMADDAIEHIERLNALDPEEALLRLLRAGRHACAAPSRRRSGSTSSRASSAWAGTRSATRSSPTRSELGVIPQDAQLTPWPTDLIKNWDDAQRRREEALRAADGGLCGLPRLCRRRDRPRRPGGRGHGQARQHADHLHQRRQRRQRRRVAGRHAQRDDLLQRRRGAGRRPDAVLRRVGLGQDLSALRRSAGPGR